MKKNDSDWAKEMRDLRKSIKELEEMADDLEKTANEWMDFEKEAAGQEEKETENAGLRNEFHRLPPDYPSPRDILRKHFPGTADQCNFSGGWGYDADHAVIVKEFDPEINPDEKFDGVSLEYAFIDKRIREELIFSRPEGERFRGLDHDILGQSLHHISGVPYDCIRAEVTAYPEKDWNELKEDWETHNCYEGDPEGRKRNLDRRRACGITYQTEFWFDISDFFNS